MILSGRVEFLFYLSKFKPYLRHQSIKLSNKINDIDRKKKPEKTENLALALNSIHFGNRPVATVSFMLRQSETCSTFQFAGKFAGKCHTRNRNAGVRCSSSSYVITSRLKVESTLHVYKQSTREILHETAATKLYLIQI